MFSAVVLVTSLQCNEWCGFCDFGLDERSGFSMSGKEGAEYLRAAHDLSPNSVARRVEILGGEPFLYYKDLRDIVRCASQLGFRTEVVTNGFWATTEESTRRQVGDLLDVGLDELTLTVDTYHLRHVSVANIQRAITEIRRRGREVNIIYRVARADALDTELIRLPAVNSGITAITVVPWVPLGHRGPDIDQRFVCRPLGNSSPGCKNLFRFVVLPGGDVAPCVVGGFRGLHRVGNLNETPAAEILTRIQTDPLLTYLYDQGPNQLTSFLASRDGTDELQVNASTCHLCYKVFSDGRLSSAVRDGLNSAAVGVAER